MVCDERSHRVWPSSVSAFRSGQFVEPFKVSAIGSFWKIRLSAHEIIDWRKARGPRNIGIDDPEVFEMCVAVADGAVEHERLEQVLERMFMLIDIDELAGALEQPCFIAAFVLVGGGKTVENAEVLVADFEHLQFLLPTNDFRVQGDGIGASTSIRRHRSNELGHAFCRWFLHDHLNITYFEHMEHVLRRSVHRAFAGLRVERTSVGDTPYYFCAESVDKIFLSEAKGRYSSVGFSSAEFASWRAQFNRVAVKDHAGHPRTVKGFIVATRFATETKPTVRTTLFAEDPQTPGDGPLSAEDGFQLGATVISAHYGEIAAKLNQPLLASALTNGFSVPEEIRFPVTIWTFQMEPLKGVRFVGGYYPSAAGSLPVRQVDGRIIFDLADPLRLDVGRGTFFGVGKRYSNKSSA